MIDQIIIQVYYLGGDGEGKGNNGTKSCGKTKLAKVDTWDMVGGRLRAANKF